MLLVGLAIPILTSVIVVDGFGLFYLVLTQLSEVRLASPECRVRHNRL
jgi:hypothetical protein